MLVIIHDHNKTPLNTVKSELKGNCIMSSKYKRHLLFIIPTFKPCSSSPLSYFGQLVFAIALYV